MKSDLWDAQKKRKRQLKATFHPNMASIDWSECNVWSYKLGDFKRKPTLKTMKSFPVEPEMKESEHGHHDHSVLEAVGSGIVSCTNCMRNQLHHIVPNIHLPHPDHHGTVYTAYAQFTAGALGGGAATYSTHWLDTIKVKMQTFPSLYKSSFYCLKTTVKEEGLTGLYQGATPAVVGQMCKTAVVFMSYGLCEELVRKATGCSKVEDLTIWHHAGSGAMTGVVASFVLCPMELVKCRLQALHSMSIHKENPKLRLSPAAMIKDTVRKHGIQGLYRGLPGIWMKDVPGSFIYFGSYESAKSVMRHFNEKDQLNGDKNHHTFCPSGTRAVFLCGMFAGLCYCITHPIDSVRTRVQVMSAVSDTKGFLRAFMSILKAEGLAPLCSGMKPCMIRACLYSGIQFVTYEKAKEYFLRDD